MTPDELRAYVDDLRGQLETLRANQKKLEKFNRDCCSNADAFINALPRKCCEFTSNVYIIKETDVRFSKSDNAAVFEKKIEFAPCALEHKKKSGYVISKPTIFFSDPVTRFNEQIRSSPSNNSENNSFSIVIKKPRKEEVFLR